MPPPGRAVPERLGAGRPLLLEQARHVLHEVLGPAQQVLAALGARQLLQLGVGGEEVARCERVEPLPHGEVDQVRMVRTQAIDLLRQLPEPRGTVLEGARPDVVRILAPGVAGEARVTLTGQAGAITQTTPLRSEQKAIYQALSITPPPRITTFDPA